MTILAWAVVEGHTIKVFDDDTTPAVPGIGTSWNPPGSPGTTTKTIHTGAEVWNIMAAATFSIHRRDLGLSAQTLTLYMQECPFIADDSCYDLDNDAVYINPLHGDRKFLVAHELGHYLLGRKLGVAYVPYLDYDADHAECGGTAGHEMPQVEWQPAGFWEGFAHFYAATVFNNTGQSDCFLQYYGIENYDEDLDNDPRTTNCAGVPWEDANGDLMHAVDQTNDPDVGEQAYLDDIPFIDCDDSGMPTVNVSTEYDWARFLWAMNQEGMTVAQIADVVALSSPEFWGNEPPTNFHPAALLQGAVDEYDLTHTPDWGPTWSGLASDHAVDR